MRLFFRKLGEGKATPLMIMHGLLGSSENWLSMARALSRERVVYVPDLRNHGQSFHAEVHTLGAMAGDIEALLEAEGLGSVYLLGHSMGGKVAMQLSLSHGERVRGLVVVDVGVKRYAVQHDALFRSLLDLDLSGYDKRDGIAQAMEGFVPERGMRQFLLKNIVRGAEGFKWRIPLALLHRHLPDIAAEIHGGVYAGPAFFVYGGRSSYVEEGDKAGIRRLFRGAVFRCLRDAGHWVHADAAVVFRAALETFLRECDGH